MPSAMILPLSHGGHGKARFARYHSLPHLTNGIARRSSFSAMPEQDFCEVVEKEEDIRYHMRHWRQGKSYDPSTAYN